MATALLGLLLVLAVAAGVHGHWDFAGQSRDTANAAATTAHPAGTDDLGRDRAVRLALALLLAVAGAGVAAALTTLIGGAVGLLGGSSPRLLGPALLYLSDLFLALPWLFLLMLVRAALPLNLAPMASAALTFLLLGLLGWPVFARINVARVRALRGSAFLLQARAAGLRPAQVLRAHLLPHLRPLLLQQFFLYLPISIAAEANLGALGLGVAEPLPSLGGMLLELRRTALFGATAWAYAPLALLVVVLVLLEMTAVEEGP